MGKAKTALPFISLLLFSALAFSARRAPLAFAKNDMERDQDSREVRTNYEDDCNGVGEDECLVRRTLAAHTDYIYTQKQKP